MWKTFLLVLSVFVLAACSSSDSSNDSDSGAPSTNACAAIGLGTKVINGQTCSGLESSAVVRVALLATDGVEVVAFPVCTGTMISSDDVLTATHCFQADRYAGYDVIGAGILMGDADNAQYIDGQRFVRAPGYSNNGERTFRDAAIISLERTPGLPSIPLLVRAAPQSGAEVLVYGYGRQQSGDGVEEDLFFELKGGAMTLGSVTPNHLFVGFSGSGVNVCNGDSGGPMLYQVQGTPALIGVVSEGSITGCQAGDVTTYTNVVSEPLLSWIIGEVPDAGTF